MDTFDRYVGQVFDNRYRIVKVIGIGGMAVVFEAVDLVMKRPVAVKMLREDIADDTPSVKRFVNESKAVSMLNHPNIVSIYDVSVSDKLKYIVMEYIEGITLKSYIQNKGSLNLREILACSEQVLRALEHAHSKGIIHRDIKPQNIMLLKNGQLKVTDFGIAKLPNAETVTQTDRAIGTVFYISPEQAKGQPIDPRSDLYSFGVVMYEMATGRLPFVGDTPVSVALMQINDQPKAPHELAPQVPKGLEQIIMGAMEKDPAKRFQSAGQMLKYLTELKNNPSVVFHGEVDPSVLPDPHRVRNNPRDNMKKKKRSGLASLFGGNKKPSRPSSVKQTANGPKKSTTQPKKKRKYKQSTSMMPIILGVVSAFLLAAGISGAYLLPLFFSPDTAETAKSVQIPSFLGQTMNEELRAEIESYRYYRLKIVPVYSDSHVENTVISQEPSAGEFRKVLAGKQYCDLTLTVSMGVETVPLEDLTALDYRIAEAKLRAKGLIPDKVEEYNELIPAGYVFRTDPQPGTPLNVGDHVTVYVSRGLEVINTTVPNFVGMTEEEAMAALTEYDLTLGNVTYEHSSTYPAGMIMFQSVEAFSEVPAKQTRIYFTVSAGRDPSYDPYKDPNHPLYRPETDPGETTENTTPETDPPQPGTPGWWWS